MEVQLKVNCPHCGADTRNAVTICPLCGKTLDRENAYNSYLAKGDDAFAAGKTDKAIMSYKKALEYSAGNEDIFLKLGNAYNKRGDRQAAPMYMKALTFNFYNDKTHNMMIALYSKYGKLDDLKRWYEQSREKADPVFVDKYIKIIQNVKYFSTQEDFKIPSPKPDGIIATLAGSMKKYVIMNIVIGIVLVVAGLAITAGIVFKVNTMFIFMFLGFFLLVSITIVIISRRGRANKKDGKKPTLEQLMAEELAKAIQNSKVKSQNGNQNEPPVS
jgi:pentatricopeptide repeat protein